MPGYGLIRDRDPLLDQLIPELTGLRLGSNHRVHQLFPRGADLPVVLLTGPRGIGKTAVLDTLARGYARRLPLARLDLADPELAWPSPLTALLFRLTQRLAGPVHGQPRMHCLRLNLGLAAMSASSLPKPRDRTAWDKSVKLLSQVVAPEPEPGAETGHASPPVPDWVNSLPDIFTAPTAEARRVALIRTAFAIIAVHLGSIRLPHVSLPARAALNWYAGLDPTAHDGMDALVRLSGMFKRGGDQREQAENTLLAAFRADVCDAFTGIRGRNRVVRPLLLLEGADTSLGVQLLLATLGHRQEAAESGQPADPVVIVGTIGRGTEFDGADRRGLSELKYHTWRRGTEAASGALIVELTPLAMDDVRQLFDGPVLARVQSDLRSIVYRMTQGNPLGATGLAEAVHRQALRDSGRLISGPDLLTLPPPTGGRDMLTWLLKRLIPDDEIRGWLIALAAAEDAAEAAVIATACAPGQDAPRRVHACQLLLRDQGWPDSDEEFIGDPFVRTLLLAEFHRSGTALLARSGVRAESGYGWEQIVRRLRNHSRTHRLRRTYHGLTLAPDPGRAASIVASRLRRGFDSVSSASWLGTVGTLGRAPYFGPPESLSDAALEPPEPGHDQVFSVIRRLLLTTWFLSDPRVGPEQRLISVLQRDLRRLEEQRPGDGDAFAEASRAWPQAFADGSWPVRRTWTTGGPLG